ncbi:MAG: hypothetical protein HKN70_13440, partial [Gammaproteobacteria bacterium]|nr:hypothetical protein [Gammaproteobacteria bacterium]
GIGWNTESTGISPGAWMYLALRGDFWPRLLVVDSDGDGVEDAVDNCQLHTNAEQRDTNGDGYGNICDPDLNDDGIVNFADVALWAPFFNTSHKGNADFNGDGLTNFVDFAVFSEFFLRPPGPSGLTP